MKRLFFPILIASIWFLTTRVRCEEISHPKQQFSQQNSATQHANSPSGGNPGIKPQDSPDTETKNHQTPEVRVTFPPVTVTKDCLDYAVPVVTLLFAGALVVVSFMQWRTYEAQRKLQHQQTVLANRPHLRVRRVTLLKEPEVDRPVKVGFDILNWGGTPAYIVSSNVTVRVELPAQITPWREDGDLHYVEKYLADGKPESIIESGMTVEVSKEREIPRFLQPHELPGLKEGRFAVYLLGHLFYRDDAGQHHRTDFCRAWTWQERRFRTVDDPDLEHEV